MSDVSAKPKSVTFFCSGGAAIVVDQASGTVDVTEIAEQVMSRSRDADSWLLIATNDVLLTVNCKMVSHFIYTI